MIVPSMTYKEIFDSMEKDMTKVKIRIDKMYPKVVRTFKRSQSFPMMYTDEYKIPSTNNTYITFYYARNIEECKKPYYTAFAIIFNGTQRFVLYSMQMGYKHTLNSKSVMLPQIHVYSSHFLQRYNERCLHNSKLTPNQIAGIYILRNTQNIVPIEINEDINKNLNEYGKSGRHGVCVPDGFCFTRSALQYQPSEDGIREHDSPLAIVYLYTTFVSEVELSDSQKNAINKEHLEVLRQCVKSIDDSIS